MGRQRLRQRLGFPLMRAAWRLHRQETKRQTALAAVPSVVQENRIFKAPSDTTTAITAQANTQARAGALMAHHPAWVGPNPTVRSCPLRWGRLWGCSPTAHKCHDSMSPNDEKGRTLPQHGSGASFRSTEQHKVTQVSHDVSDSQPADGVLCTACPMEGKDEHEEESSCSPTMRSR